MEWSDFPNGLDAHGFDSPSWAIKDFAAIFLPQTFASNVNTQIEEAHDYNDTGAKLSNDNNQKSLAKGHYKTPLLYNRKVGYYKSLKFCQNICLKTTN